MSYFITLSPKLMATVWEDLFSTLSKSTEQSKGDSSNMQQKLEK